MKKRFLFAFVAASLIAIPTSYAATPDEIETASAVAAPVFAESASTRAPQVESKIASPSWLEGRGALDTTQILELLGAQVSLSQRTQIEAAVAARNAAIQAANAGLAGQLQSILKTDDAALAKNAADQKEARELAIIRRQQPGRYQAIMRQKRAQQK